MADTGTGQCSQGSVYFTQKVFQTLHDGIQGHMQSEKQKYKYSGKIVSTPM